MHEIAELRKCRTCFYRDDKALSFNKEAHEREDWEVSMGFCEYPYKIIINEDGSCRHHKELSA